MGLVWLNMQANAQAKHSVRTGSQGAEPGRTADETLGEPIGLRLQVRARVYGMVFRQVFMAHLLQDRWVGEAWSDGKVDARCVLCAAWVRALSGCKDMAAIIQEQSCGVAAARSQQHAILHGKAASQLAASCETSNMSHRMYRQAGIGAVSSVEDSCVIRHAPWGWSAMPGASQAYRLSARMEFGCMSSGGSASLAQDQLQSTR